MRGSGAAYPLIGDTVVLNTSSLSSLVITGCFEILQLCFRNIFVPEAVLSKFSQRYQLPAGVWPMALGLRQKLWAASLGVGTGESQAIILAADLEVPLIMDDQAARIVAERHGVSVISSIGLVRIAFLECVIERAEYEHRILSFEQKRRANPRIISWARDARKLEKSADLD